MRLGRGQERRPARTASVVVLSLLGSVAAAPDVNPHFKIG